jgi:hypothetical protein
MDKIEYEIEQSQIGKRGEPLTGWEDQPKKGIGTNYPAMRAKGPYYPPVTDKLYKYTPPSRESGSNQTYYLVEGIVSLVVAVAILIAAFWGAGKILGYW